MPDRRRHLRTPVNLAAKLLLGNQQDGYGCTVLDRSDSGVLIDLGEELDLPDRLVIRFSDEASQLVRRCWSSGTKAGLEFIDLESQPSDQIKAPAPAGGAEEAIADDYVRITPTSLGQQHRAIEMLYPAELIHALLMYQNQQTTRNAIRLGTEMQPLFSPARASDQIGFAPQEQLNFFGEKWQKFVA